MMTTSFYLNKNWLLTLYASLALTACGGGNGTTIIDPSLTSGDWSWKEVLPPNFPTPKVPKDNPMSNAKFELGRYLFYDKRLSGQGTFACASCHQPELGFADGKVVSVGEDGGKTLRNAPSIVNVAYSTTLTWANPQLTTLEKQMETPLFGTNPVEMGVNDSNRATILARFKSAQDVDYPKLFSAAFPQNANTTGTNDDNVINFTHIIQAIATFQRGVLSGQSRYERYLKNEITLTAEEMRGLNLFNGEKAECFHCHGSFNFNDQVDYLGNPNTDLFFHNTGLYNIGNTSKGTFPTGNRGLYEITGKDDDMGAFRAQSLFNVGLTAPYMHDGSLATLEEVLDFYAAGGRNIESGEYAGDGRANPYKSSLISNIDLTPQEKADLVAFLKTLSDESLKTNKRYQSPF